MAPRDETQGISFIREVDEELQVDRLVQFWKKYGDFLVTVAVAVVLLAVGFVGYREFREYQKSEAATAYFEAQMTLRAGQVEEVESQLQTLTESSVEAVRLMAYLTQGKGLVRQGKKDEALALYIQAAESGLPSLYQQYFVLLAAYLELDLNKDTERLTEQMDRLISQGSIWIPQAYEVKALAALQRGDKEEALRNYEYLLSETLQVPDSMRQRAEAMKRMIVGVHGVS